MGTDCVSIGWRAVSRITLPSLRQKTLPTFPLLGFSRNNRQAQVLFRNQVREMLDASLKVVIGKKITKERKRKRIQILFAIHLFSHLSLGVFMVAQRLALEEKVILFFFANREQTWTADGRERLLTDDMNVIRRLFHLSDVNVHHR